MPQPAAPPTCSHTELLPQASGTPSAPPSTPASAHPPALHSWSRSASRPRGEPLCSPRGSCQALGPTGPSAVARRPPTGPSVVPDTRPRGSPTVPSPQYQGPCPPHPTPSARTLSPQAQPRGDPPQSAGPHPPGPSPQAPGAPLARQPPQPASPPPPGSSCRFPRQRRVAGRPCGGLRRE